MYQSNKNANLMRRFKVNDDMQLWAVVQGRNFDECKLWYDDLTKDHPYDGYCISLSIHKSGTEIPWIEQLQFAKTVPKRIHFLGFSTGLPFLLHILPPVLLPSPTTQELLPPGIISFQH